MFNDAQSSAGASLLFRPVLQVNYSMMVGAILSWGIAWPLLNNRAGSWYPADLPNPANNFQGPFAYHVRLLLPHRAERQFICCLFWLMGVWKRWAGCQAPVWQASI